MRQITLRIEAGPLHCDECAFKYIFNTGLAGEFHPACRIFKTPSPWGKWNMKRPEECLQAEKEQPKGDDR